MTQILAIDDEPEILRLYELYLKNCAQITVTSDAQVVFDRVKSDKIDLVITDIRMPGKSGPQILAEIRKINAELPVIFCSAFMNDHRIVSASSQGLQPSAYMTKPFNQQQLIGCLQSLLGNKLSPKTAA